jgi:metal-responsive CopG/Arc/MetJ family transcriptional regulator
MANKTIQVRLDEKLLNDLNGYAVKHSKTRADFIRDACECYLKKMEESEMERRYAEIFQKLGSTDAVDILEQIPVEVSPYET